MPATISVALCTYNGARFVGAQLSSILDQSRTPDELIVSDDGSFDDTVAVVEETIRIHAAQSDGRAPVYVAHVNDRPLGVTRNFERTVTACTGTLVALSDQDDVWHRDRLERLVREFDEDPGLLLLHTDARLVDEQGAPLGMTLFEALEITAGDRALELSGGGFDALLRRNLATGATVIFRRELLEQALPFPAEWVHDEWLAIIAAATGRITVVPEPTIDYRQHGANQIGVRAPTLRHKVRRVLESRSDRNAALARKFMVLADRLDELGDAVTAEDRQKVRRKAEFEAFRDALPTRRWRRIRAVLRADRADLYTRFASRGRADVIRDLLQPA
ncbi:MAG TPA: glycosyltransferase family 2 protein [Microbacteriaceae bacterium]|nr:glycosyltransferase family 2 protein [Microbacteriaceae bacterium]